RGHTRFGRLPWCRRHGSRCHWCHEGRPGCLTRAVDKVRGKLIRHLWGACGICRSSSNRVQEFLTYLDLDLTTHARFQFLESIFAVISSTRDTLLQTLALRE